MTASESSCRIARSRPWWARLERALLGGVVDVDAVDQEAFAELRHHGVVLVEDAGRAGEQAEPAFPVQPAAAVDADQPRPGAVVELAQRGENARRVPRGASTGSSRSL